jgi:hypothetical protein
MSYLDAPRLHVSGWFPADDSTIDNDVRTFRNAPLSVGPSCESVRAQGRLS